MAGWAEWYSSVVTGERRGMDALLARAGLRLLSVPYALAAMLRNWCYDRGWFGSRRVPVPVLSVGNLTMGGTGKTPCVEYLAAVCRDRFQRRPVILSRGYGAAAGPNDEAMVLEENLPDVPHLQGRDRAALAETAIEELEADMLILDDGFQHRRLQRDCDIVLLDATRPLAREWVCPGGMLREPAAGLRRAHCAILTRCDQSNTVAEQRGWLARRFPKLPVAESIHAPVTWGPHDLPIDAFRDRPAAAFCGIGNPRAFEQTLAALGCRPSTTRVFPDHHNYTRTDVDDLTRWAETLPADAAILTTQKDWVKLRLDSLGGRTLAALRIGLKLTAGEPELHAKLESLLGEPPPLEP